LERHLVRSNVRAVARTTAARLLGERALPMGAVATERRLVLQALSGQFVGAVLVVGPGLAVRQALAGTHVDVAGTSPHNDEVTVCSRVQGPGSLPHRRWDTVIIAQRADADLPGRLAAIAPACRPGARLLVMERADRSGIQRRNRPPEALASVADIRGHVGRPGRGVWLARVPS
jgi:hypothetical protein